MKRAAKFVSVGGAAALTVGLLASVGASPAAAAEEPWVVAMGDSYMSGEGGVYTNKHIAVLQAGDPNPPEWTWTRDTMGGLPQVYFDSPDGTAEQIPFCHRSPFSPGYIEGYQTLNLACSGAEAISKISGTGAKALPKPGVDFTELTWNGQSIKGQATQLQEFATNNDVKVITLSIGGNDFGFADLASQLLSGGTVLFGSQPVTFAAVVGNSHPGAAAYNKWSGEDIVQTTSDRITSAVKNIQLAMANAGKSPDSYKIVYQSTPRPVPNGPNYNPQETADLLDLILDDAGIKSRVGGCPVWGKEDGTAAFGPFVDFDLSDYPGDAEWVYDTVFPNLIRAQRTGVAAAVAEMGADGPMVVFNDVSESFSGNELCGTDIVRQPNYTPTQFSWPDNPPVFGPGQGLDTEWINAVGFVDGLAGGPGLSELNDSPRNVTQVLHPNFWGQRALAACNELAVKSSFGYVKCERDTSGLADEVGRPLMRSGTPSEFVPMAPVRALDTRESGPEGKAGPVATGSPVEVDLAGKIPADATAVAFNVTVTGQTSSGFAEVAPAGSSSGTSTVNWTAPLQTIANGHISKVAGGKLQVSVGGAGTAHVLLDVTGAFVPVGSEAGAGSLSAAERRVYDSRDGDGPLAPGASRTLNINDDVRAMAQEEAPTAAAVNVTVTGTQGSGVLSVAKAQTTATSTINWSGVNQTIANAVITDVAEDGSFTVTNSGKTAAEVIVDLTGVFTPGSYGSMFYPGDPTRSYDSRVADRALTDTRSRLTTHPVPADAVAIAVNTTITGNEGSGYLSVTDPDTAVPLTSTVNWYEGQTTRANGTISGLEEANSRAFVGGAFWTHYIQDVSGYFK